MAGRIATRFLIVSDTHGDEIRRLPSVRVDVAIHCGDLTEESKLDEFKASIKMLKEIDAPVKLVIAGNHDWTLDAPTFRKKLTDIASSPDDKLVKREYGSFGEARGLFESEDAKAAGIVFLDGGTHHFALNNGAELTIYASPYTPSLSEWRFSYAPQQDHDWNIDSSVDLVLTHGLPKGVLDYTDSRQRAGSASLFAAVARARPLLHCFGHIHEAWGAKKVAWREEPTDMPPHFTDIDNDESHVIHNLAGLRPNRFDTKEMIEEKESRWREYEDQGCCSANVALERGKQTLFVNAAIEGLGEEQQFPWVVDIALPKRA